MELTLRALLIDYMVDPSSSVRWQVRWLEVIDALKATPEGLTDRCLPPFRTMCQAITEDIQSARGSGASALEDLRLIASGETELIKARGHGWVTHITPERVWFKGRHHARAGGAVSFDQYRLAVLTYVRFLTNPAAGVVEVPFPSD